MITKETVLIKLENIYQAAVKTNKWHIVLHVTELQDTSIGLFEKRRFLHGKRILDILKKKFQDLVAALEKYESEVQRMKKISEENYLKNKSVISNHPPP